MRRRICRFTLARGVALAIGVGALGSFAFASSAMAVVAPPAGQPLAGLDCAANATPASGSAVASGSGKITGRGATLPLYLVTQYIHSFSHDVCGPVAADTAANAYTPPAGTNEPTGDPTDPSNPVDAFVSASPQPTYSADEMLTYNYPAAQDTSATGSGQGRVAISCRTDAFGGSDIPYSMADFAKIDGAPGAEAGGLGSCLKTSFVSPFQGTGQASDPPGKMMSFPIGGGAVAFAVNLPAACQNTAAGTTPYQFTTADIAALMSGNQASWAGLDPTNDPNLTAANGCDIPVTRVVRQDTSGTTQNLFNYLGDANGTSVQLCGTGTTLDSGGNTVPTGTFVDLKNETVNTGGFSGGNASEDNVWPTGAGSGGRANCNGLLRGATSGNPPLLHQCVLTSGCIGYSDLSDAVHDPGDLASLALPQVQSSAGTFANPNNGDGSSNCSYSGASLPGTSNDNFMGINGEWALDAAGGNHTDVSWTAQGAAWPACALTWEFTFEGDDGNAKVSLSGNQTILPQPGSISAAITSGATVTSISVAPLAAALQNGEVVTVASGSNTESFTLSANAAKGATSIAVTSQTATATFPAGSALATQTLKLLSVPAGTPTQGKFTVTAGGTLQEGSYTGFSTPAASTTTADLPSGTTSPTTLSVTATSAALYTGESITVSSGANSQKFTLTANAPAGSTSLSVSFTPSPTTVDYPVGSTVTLPTSLTGVGPTGFSGAIAAATAVMSLPSGSGGPEPELNPNQRRTLYSYMSYVLSDAAQGTAPGAGYAQLPESFISRLRGAFQADY